jgi:putative endonuclease
MPKPWYTYIVLCRDNSLYTGVTTDPERRLAEHNSAGGGCRYTRIRKPVRLVYVEEHSDRSAACRREFEIKGMAAAGKRLLIAAGCKPCGDDS